MNWLRTVLCGTALCLSAPAMAQYSDNEIRIGLMTDMASIYKDIAGQGAIIAAEMAVEDFGGQVGSVPIQLITVDHELNGEVAEREARRLIREHNVDVFAELVGSNTAIPVQHVAREGGQVVLHSGSASSSLTGENCSPTGVHWTYDTHALGAGTARAMVAQGAKRWFFLTADYSFGHVLEADTAAFVQSAGGLVVGSARHPFKGTDFESYLLEAQDSGADVIALANAGGDTLTAIRQAYEYGIFEGGQTMAALLVFLTDIRQLGLYVSSGLTLTTGFYWDMDEQTREFSERFRQRHGAPPTMVQAGVYSSLMHYFRAIEAAGTDTGVRVVERMRAMPVNDFFARNGRVRADGRMVHDMYLMRVKRPGESRAPWDYLELVEVIPGDQAFRPEEQGGCPHLQ